jgi:hypothetical protein
VVVPEITDISCDATFVTYMLLLAELNATITGADPTGILAMTDNCYNVNNIFEYFSLY